MVRLKRQHQILSDTNDKHGDLAITIDEHIHDFADFGVGRVIDALLVPMRVCALATVVGARA
jgi:hypothetical protein